MPSMIFPRLGATITGRVQRVAVREGAHVAEGELLVALEQSELRAAVAQVRAARDRARARVQSVATLALPNARESQSQAESNLALAEREHKRSQELLAQGFISQARVDETERQLQVAARCDRIIELVDGNIAGDRVNAPAKSQSD